MAWGNGAIACAKEEPPWPVIRPVANGNAFWIWTPLWLPPNLARKIWVWDLGTAWAARPWVLATVGTVGTDWADNKLAKNGTMVPSPEHQKTCCWNPYLTQSKAQKSQVETGS